MKNILFGIFVMLVVGGVAVGAYEYSLSSQEEILPPVNNQISPTATATTDQSGVPLPSQEDIIRTFFNLINEGRIEDAVGMLSIKSAPDDSTRQAWGVQFNIFKQIKLTKIETAGENLFKITLLINLKPEAALAQPIPNFGWDNGENIRWTELVKENNFWKIKGIATGP